jgi:hypothetical protein
MPWDPKLSTQFQAEPRQQRAGRAAIQAGHPDHAILAALLPLADVDPESRVEGLAWINKL